MKRTFRYSLIILLLNFSVEVIAQEDASIFFSRIPEMLKNYSSPGNPCANAVEFDVNKNDAANSVKLSSANLSKGAKGKAKLNVSEGGNKTVWYKLVFSTDCELSFRIYSDKANDTYHFFVYKDDGSKDFCKKLSDKKVIPIRANMLAHKEGIIGTGISQGMKINYKDTSENYFKRTVFDTPFLDEIKAKSGETYYINIYHMEGTDPYHYLVLRACYKEINLLTQNDNISGKQAKIIEKLPEHVTKPSAEKDSIDAVEKAAIAKKKSAEEAKKKQKAEGTKVDAEAKKNADAEKKEKAKAEAAEKKIAEAKAKQNAAEAAKKKAAEEAFKKSSVKKISPQLVNYDEKDTLNQYQVEGKIIYEKGPRGPVISGEIYISNSDGSITVLKKMYTNDSGMFRFANLPKEHNYQLSLNDEDPNINLENEPIISGVMLLKGEPVEGLVINNSVKTASDGSFSLGKKEFLAINVNELFNRWSIDLTNPSQYSEMLKKYGAISLEGLSYKVQVGAYREEENFNLSLLNDLGPVEKQKHSDGITRFVMGDFKTLNEADGFKQKVFEKKINDAFIIAYFNGTKKYLEELIEKKMLEK